MVFGRVELAGKVIEHETGYRAERAHIAELIPTTTDGGVTRSLARRLELPLGLLGTHLRSSARCRRWRQEDRTDSRTPDSAIACV
ncbi:MAG: hypothetical protein K0R20_2049 [Actinomycetia bacterium]|nr:hypothetical protein [Actinomycetes bacterium]